MKNNPKEDLDLMTAIAGTNELGLFDTDIVRDVIDYKWNAYAYGMHSTNGLIHFLYVASLMFFINYTYLERHGHMVADSEGV